MQHFPPTISNIQKIVKAFFFFLLRCWNFPQQFGSKGLEEGIVIPVLLGASYGYTSRILTMDLVQHSYLKESFFPPCVYAKGFLASSLSLMRASVGGLICLIQPSLHTQLLLQPALLNVALLVSVSTHPHGQIQPNLKLCPLFLVECFQNIVPQKISAIVSSLFKVTSPATIAM